MTKPSDLVLRLATRVRLLDRIIVEHHSASVMREEHHACPVCMGVGGVDFFWETDRLLREVPISDTVPESDECGCDNCRRVT